MSDEVTIRWGDKTYSAGELTAGDMIAMEDEFGDAFPRLDFGSVKVACWIVWLVRRHDQADLPFEDVAAITMVELEAGVEAEAAGAVPPTSGPRKRPSRSGGVGSRGTRSGSASTPGTSSE